jgi:hypothetical protein
MDPISDAVAAIDVQDPGEHLSYRAAADRFGVDKETVRRRHKGTSRSRAGAAQQCMLLNPQQEIQLVQYIEKLSKRSSAATQSIIRNYASVLAKWEVSDSWISQFLARHRNHLTSQWTNNMDRNCHQAATEDSYRQYFELLQAKIQEYNVEPRHIYNMDKKGFAIGVNSKQKRIFSKHLFEQKRKTAGLQDGNRAWITILACICADGVKRNSLG